MLQVTVNPQKYKVSPSSPHALPLSHPPFWPAHFHKGEKWAVFKRTQRYGILSWNVKVDESGRVCFLNLWL
jgi:hypothetical protein